MARSEVMKELQAIMAERESRRHSPEHAKEHAKEDAIIAFALYIAGTIRQSRLARDWTQEQLAREMNTTQPAIARLENPGSGKMPNLYTVLRAFAALDIDLFLVGSEADASGAIREILEQRAGAGDTVVADFLSSHPSVHRAAVVMQEPDGGVILPEGTRVDIEPLAPLIEFNWDDA